MFARTCLLVTIESDPTRYHGEHAHRPALPGRGACEQLLAHLVTDLERTFPQVREFSIALPGALYDQTQILRPGLPVFDALEQALADAVQPTSLAVVVGGHDDHRKPLQPDPKIPPGLLQNLPLLLTGDPFRLEPVAEAMEHRFLEEGQLSAHTAKALEAHFGIAVQHARFMTLTDIEAMLKLQFEHFGFAGLWALLDAALNQPHQPVSVTARGGQRFDFADGTVTAQFESFDTWARRISQQAGEKNIPNLEAGYLEWTREYRQYVTTLEAHAIPLIQRPVSSDCTLVEGDYLVEASANDPVAPGSAEVTEHACGDVGVIAVSVIEAGKQCNYYPLSATGLNTLHRAIRQRGLGPGGFAYPGCIVHDPETGRLVPEAQSDDRA